MTDTTQPEPTPVPTAPTLDPITLTPVAAAQVKEAMRLDGLPEAALRVGVYGGGCSGLEYLLDFADEPLADDLVFTQHGVRIFVDPLSARELRGTVLDYVDNAMGTGFKFDNPNVAKFAGSCGCNCNHGC